MWAPTYQTDYLAHHGILGMKWGVRRYQNKDGTLTAEGRRHVNTYKTSGEYHKRTQEARKRVDEEGNKLIKRSKGLSRDFGGKHENVDDHEYFEYEARQRGLNTDSYWNSYSEFKKIAGEEKNYNSLNKNSIKKGKKIVESKYSSKKISALSGATNAKAELIYKQSKLNAERISKSKQKSSSKVSSNLDYNKIYKEMGADMSNEDPDYYREIERKWKEKHR